MSDLFEHISRKARKIKGKLTSSASISSNLSATTSMTQALRSLHDSAGLFPPLQAAIASLSACVERVEVGSVYISLACLRTLTPKADLAEQAAERHIKTSQSTHVSEFLERLAASVKEQVTIIISLQNSGRAGHLRKAMQDEDEILDGYRRITDILEELQAEASLKMWNIAEQQLANSHLKSLSPVHLAAYNSSLSEDANRRSCTEGTRVNILAELNQWSVDPTKPNVFWMNGMAGTGKTTIAYTFAKSLRERGTLGASFFCTRTSNECQDVRQIIPTIAYQLARHWPSFRSALLGVLEQESEIQSQAITSQCERLIKDPLSKVKDGMIKGLVVVIDALDECSNPKGVGTILEALFRIAPGLPVRFFVTSRPEADIRHRVEAQPGQNRLMCVLHDIEESLVQADITLYLRAELASSDVSEFNVTQLASLSGKLFIYAATAVRYIRQAGTMVDQDRLEAILSSASDSDYRHSEITNYIRTIRRYSSVPIEREPREQEWMRLILWTAVCTREPVTIDTLAASPDQTSKGECTTPIAILCAARIAARSKRFYCDETKHSQLLSKHCFDIMRDQLRFNICGLETSFIADSEVKGLKARIDRSISPTLSYAAHHWGHHVSKSTHCEETQTKLEDFLSNQLLFWMEVLSLKGTLDMGIAMLSLVKPWLTAKESPSNLVKIVDDSWIFVSTFAAGSGSQSTPHIYISALAFCHPSSWVSQQYKGRTRIAITGRLGSRGEPTALLATWRMHDGTVCVVHAHNGAVVLGPLRGHVKAVSCIAISPDGSMLASGSDDGTILVRDAQRGNPIYDVIRGHEWVVTQDSADVGQWQRQSYTQLHQTPSHEVFCTAFSPDGKHIACGLGSYKSPIVIYDTFGGEYLPFPFDAHQSLVFSNAFLPNGNNLVTGHQSGDLRVWSLHNGTATHSPSKVHNDTITSIGFSPLGDKLVTGSWDRCVYIWDVENGYSNPCLLGTHDGYVYSAAFSPDGTRVASCSSDRTVKMWNPLHSTSSHTPKWNAPTQAVLSVASHLMGHALPQRPLVAHTDGSGRCILAQWQVPCIMWPDLAICLWDGTSGKLLFGPLRGHRNWVRSISFSPDGKRIVSASDDKTIRMWDVGDGTLTAIDLVGTHEDEVYCATFSPDGEQIWHKGSINSVTFSPDGQLVASGSDDGTICVFDSRSGNLVLGPLKGHEYSVNSVVFSPDGSHIVSGSGDGSVRVWVVKDGAPACEPLRGHQNGVKSVAYSPDGRYIVSGSDDLTIRVWKAPGGGVVSDLSHSVSSASDQRQIYRAIARGLTVSPDGWVRNHDSKLVFWAPSDIRRLFPTLETVYTIGPEGILHADYSQPLLLGEEWHGCYVGSG
ncbi:WD40 repeat-like protein [Rhizoctonia solani]|uniref:WD40 repeat-like protein n=1 Tax=Rhizoctonia solani TaxID=456999 RepID=A0A8H7I468_9AGAM|nr:WD40 repeat-like protein [Rhizoctonia solani]